jgi:hypothetical protein
LHRCGYCCEPFFSLNRTHQLALILNQEHAMHDPTDKLAEGKLDLVPMIDCIMLLLLFFILTTKFTAEEKQIAALLPSHGTAIMPQQEAVKPPEEINLIIVPDGMPMGLEPSLYQRAWERYKPTTARLRIGGADPIQIDAKLLSRKNDPDMKAHLDHIHAYVALGLAIYETPGARQEQAPINIHCFSGLSWSYALCVYDAVRGFEKDKTGNPPSTSSLIDQDARTVSFAPPRLRNYTKNDLGNELWELVNKH